MEFVSERVGNIVAKGGNTSFSCFLLFPQSSKKYSTSGLLKLKT